MRALLWLTGLLSTFVILSVGGFFVYRSAAQPAYQGSLKIVGLAAEVKIIRDGHAVPHILAQNADDALAGLGYAQGQDRLWQLEMNRRIASGQLSEILGEATLDTDKFIRTLGVRRNATRLWELQDATTRSAIKAYVAGINAAILEVQGKPWRQPPEFFLLDIEPQLWTPEDVIAWGTMMAWELSGNMSNELLRASLWGRLGSARLEQLLPTDPEIKLPDFGSVYGERLALSEAGTPQTLGQGFESLYLHTRKLFPSVGQEGIGSNNWVVAAARSASGAPMLANDPHLPMTTPGVWHLAHMSWPGHQVVGGGLPGLPAILSGQTANFAWGLTTFNSDTQDLVLEEIAANTPSIYVSPRGLAQMKLWKEEIKVKDAALVTIDVRETKNGPIISDVLPIAAQSLLALGARAGNVEKKFALALRWTQLLGEDRSLQAAIGMNRAKSYDEFEAALQTAGGAQQVFVYADKAGKIALLAPGLVPKRGEQNLIRGLAPVPGWNAEYEWQGYFPNGKETAFPRLVNPAEGWLASANQKPMGLSAETFTGAEFTRPYRFDRISEMLLAQPKHDLKSFATIQGDQRSLVMAKIMQALLKVPFDPSVIPRTSERLDLLRAWVAEGLRPVSGSPQGQGVLMVAERPEPLIATLWVDHFRRLLLADEIGEGLFAAFEAQRLKTDIVLDVLTNPGLAHWCDKVDTAPKESCAQIVVQSFQEALADLDARIKAKSGQSTWGAHHEVLFEHRPIGKHPQLGSVFNLRMPVGGDATTVFAARHHPYDKSDPLAVRWGPGFRSRIDLGDLEKSEFMVAPGQSGSPLSARYSDFLKAWNELRGINISTNLSKIEAASIGTVVLRAQ
jgi:penicillin G amidase